MSDQAESQRMRNWTSLWYIATSANAMTTRTPKMIQAISVLSSESGNQRDGTTGAERAQSKATRQSLTSLLRELSARSQRSPRFTTLDLPESHQNLKTRRSRRRAAEF